MKIDIKISNPNNPGPEKINVFLIILLIVFEMIALFIFFTSSKLFGSISFILVLILFFILISFLNKLFYLDTLKLEIKNSKLFVTLKNVTNEFDLKSCNLEYHSDKDEWISLKCNNGQSYDWTLVRPVSKEVVKFVNEVKLV